MKTSKLFIGLMAFLTLPSFANNLEQQRQMYQKLKEVVAISQSEPNRQLAEQMLSQLKGYPLYPYAKYLLIKQNIANKDFSELEDFQQNYPDFPFTNRLKEAWLKKHLQQHNWQAILQQANKLPKNAFSQCLVILAEWKEQKLSPKRTALLQQAIEPLWLSLNNCNQNDWN